MQFQDYIQNITYCLISKYIFQNIFINSLWDLIYAFKYLDIWCTGSMWTPAPGPASVKWARPLPPHSSASGIFKVPALYWQWTLMPPIHPCKGLLSSQSRGVLCSSLLVALEFISPLEAAMDIGCFQNPLHLWTPWASAAVPSLPPVKLEVWDTKCTSSTGKGS